MANEEHLKFLNDGRNTWNNWRAENPSLMPDLSESDLCRADLVDFNLSKVDFSSADLSRADMSVSDISCAILNNTDLRDSAVYFSDLSGAELTSAKLGYANFGNSTLVEASLRDAKCLSTNFSGAILAGADFAGATLNHTILGNVDLKDAKGLDSCIHIGPSIVDYQTLAISGKLPLKFLRGCGFPDALIEYLPSLLNDPIQYYSCFVSYSSKDQTFVELLYSNLQSKGVRCWFAPEDLKIGDKTRVRIDETIRDHEKLLVILSRHSIESAWVEKEVETAIEQEQQQKRTIVVPIRVDEHVMKIETGWPADIRRSRNIGDFCHWKTPRNYQKAFERLLRDLKT